MEMIQINTAILKDKFIHAIKLILNSTFFQFNNIIYKQIFDTLLALHFLLLSQI